MVLQALSVGFGLAYLHAEGRIAFFFTISNATLTRAFVISLFGIPILLKEFRKNI